VTKQRENSKGKIRLIVLSNVTVECNKRQKTRRVEDPAFWNLSHLPQTLKADL